MLLLIQFGLATIAGFRGRGVQPLGLMLMLVIFGFFLGLIGVNPLGGFMTILDLGLAFVLAYMAIVPPEGK